MISASLDAPLRNTRLKLWINSSVKFPRKQTAMLLWENLITDNFPWGKFALKVVNRIKEV